MKDVPVANGAGAMVPGSPSESVIPCLHCRDVETELSFEITRSLEHFKDSGFLLTDDRVFAERLARCRTCESLAQGDTCRHCGCLVAFRARRAALECPHPSGPRWGRVLPPGL